MLPKKCCNSTSELRGQPLIQRLAHLIRLLHRAPVRRINELDGQIRPDQAIRLVLLDQHRQAHIIPLAAQEERRHRDGDALLRQLLFNLVMVVPRQGLVPTKRARQPTAAPHALKPRLPPAVPGLRVLAQLDRPVREQELAHGAAHAEQVAHPVLAIAVQRRPEAVEVLVAHLGAVVGGEQLPVGVAREAGGLLEEGVGGGEVEGPGRRDVGDVEQRDADDQLRRPQPHALRAERAPVVADDDDLGDVLGGEQLDVVGDHGFGVEEGRVGRLGGAAVAELVRDDDAVGKRGEVWDYFLEEVGVVREAVEEEEGRRGGAGGLLIVVVGVGQGPGGRDCLFGKALHCCSRVNGAVGVEAGLPGRGRRLYLGTLRRAARR